MKTAETKAQDDQVLPPGLGVILARAPGEPSLLKALLHARQGLVQYLADCFRDHGLTDQQWRVLAELAPARALTASELAAASCLRASSLSRIIRDLEGRGLVSRSSDRQDLRRTMIALTAVGLAVVVDFARHEKSIVDDLRMKIGDAVVDSLAQSAIRFSIGSDVAAEE